MSAVKDYVLSIILRPEYSINLLTGSSGHVAGWGSCACDGKWNHNPKGVQTYISTAKLEDKLVPANQKWKYYELACNPHQNIQQFAWDMGRGNWLNVRTRIQNKGPEEDGPDQFASEEDGPLTEAIKEAPPVYCVNFSIIQMLFTYGIPKTGFGYQKDDVILKEVEDTLKEFFTSCNVLFLLRVSTKEAPMHGQEIDFYALIERLGWKVKNQSVPFHNCQYPAYGNKLQLFHIQNA